MKSVNSIAAKLAFALGKGVIAGLAGTAAITVSQLIEMKLTGRKPSATPAKAVGKVLHLRITNNEYKEQFVQEIHWTYGLLWGFARTALDMAGVKGMPATAVHYAAIWGTELVMLPSIDVAPPVMEWGGKEIAKDGLNHLVYALAAGLVYDSIDR